LWLVGFCTAWGQNAGATGQNAPDNTKINDRDRSKSEATAGQQKENPSDRAMTQQIRRAILQDKSFLPTHTNVKVITQDGNVILKGPVRSIGEKRTVEAKAIAVAAKTE